jgi:hypothetical protein
MMAVSVVHSNPTWALRESALSTPEAVALFVSPL